MSACARPTPTLRVVGAIAVLFFATSGALADEPVAGTPQDQTTCGSTPGMTLASLSPTIIGPENSNPDRPLERTNSIQGGSGVLATPNAIVGLASFYDDPGETASGELYDPGAFTAAAQLEIRHKFGGIRF